MQLSIAFKLFFALVMGAVIGLERESYEKKIDKTPGSGVGSLGVRSFSLITTLGAVAGLLYNSYFSLYLLIAITFMTLLLTYYVLGSIATKDNGITTELAIIFSFVIGAFISLDIFPAQLIIAMVVIMVGILSIKEKLHILVAGIKENEFSAFLSYAIIALVILPFLPNKNFGLGDIPNLASFFTSLGIDLRSVLELKLFNPFNIWRVVVIITGVDLLGYFLEQTVGQKRGWFFTSLAGGFISSTSTTQSIAQRSKSSKDINRLTAAAIFANFSSFIQHFILIATVNNIFFAKSIGYVMSIIIASFVLGIYFLNKEEKNDDDLADTKERLQNDKIFSLGPALKFAFIFLFVTIVTKISLVLFGDRGFLISTALASVTGLDATTINVSQLSGTNITYIVGLTALVISNAVNLIAKIIYSFIQGDRRFAVNFAVSMAIIVAASIISLALSF